MGKPEVTLTRESEYQFITVQISISAPNLMRTYGLVKNETAESRKEESLSEKSEN